MTERLAYRTVLVTGGSRGIGRAICLRLAREKCNLVVNYAANEKAAQETVRAIEKLGARAVAVRADVSDARQVETMHAEARVAFGPVEALVGNAGVSRHYPVSDMSDADWDFVQQTNVRGTFFNARCAARYMKENGRGRMVFISSVLGQAALPNRSCYCASKSAIIGFANSLSLELAPFGITVNTICPGWIDSDMTEYLDPEIRGEMEAQIPLGRFGRPEEVAEVAAFLLSPAGDYMTGSRINIDGGRRAYVWNFE